VPASRAYPSVALSLATLYLAALGVAAVLVPLDLAQQAESPAALALLALLPVGLGALHPAVLGRARGVVVRITGRGGDVPLPAWRATAAVVLRYVPAWLLITAATWAVARALVPDPPILRIGIATTLSWTAGFVAVPVPAGAGVREAVFVASSGMAGGVAATVAVASRLAFVLVDVAGLVLTARWHRTAPRRTGDPPVT
jgi:glycosyltransferase 2 family protein